MARRKPHRPGLEELLQSYAKSRNLDIVVLAGGQRRITDSGYVAVDVWLTGKYHVVYANYKALTKHEVWPSAGKRGTLPVERQRIGRLLDGIFFRAALVEEKHGEYKEEDTHAKR